MSFRTVDLQCQNAECGYETDHTFDLRGLETEEEKQASMTMKCPMCEVGDMIRCWRSAPTIGFGSESKNPQQYERMKESFKERFLKQELNDLRHKHGRAIDDSLRGGAVARVKKGEK